MVLFCNESVANKRLTGIPMVFFMQKLSIKIVKKYAIANFGN